MSFDTWMVKDACTHCGAPATSVYEFNLTHNVNKIVDACLLVSGDPAPNGKDPDAHYRDWSWGRFEGWTGEEAAPYLARAIEESKDPKRVNVFRFWEPDNGWGRLEDVQRVLQEFREACIKYPTAKIRVSG